MKFSGEGGMYCFFYLRDIDSIWIYNRVKVNLYLVFYWYLYRLNLIGVRGY